MTNTIHVGPLALERPAILASGLRGSTLDSLEEAYRAGAGAVITKSLTVSPREGYPEPNFVSIGEGGYINAIGLQNAGAANFARTLNNPPFPVIVSLAGESPEDFAQMIPLFQDAAGFEINLSCPHVEGFGRDVGEDPALVAEIVHTAKQAARDIPVFAKVGPNMASGVDVAVEADIDGITAINTIPAMKFDVETGKPVISHKTGGLSGKPIKLVAIRTVYDIKSKHPNVPVMGCGGICDARDAMEFMIAGASAVQIGTAAMNSLDVFRSINEKFAQNILEKKRPYS